jgi:DNA-directed RNA polymerase subunit H
MANPVTNHVLVPKHTKLNKKESEDILKKFNVALIQLPKIMITDPAIASLKPSAGDIIKIERESATRGTAVYYRVVINA